MPSGNLSADPQQAIFGDGLSEEITTQLSRFSTLIVARHTSFQFRRRDGDVRQIGRDLEMHYVLEGRVSHSFRAITIAQLNRSAAAKAAVVALLALRQDFASTAETELRKCVKEEPLIERCFEGLEKAGLFASQVTPANANGSAALDQNYCCRAGAIRPPD